MREREKDRESEGDKEKNEIRGKSYMPKKIINLPVSFCRQGVCKK